ncbi:MAG: hypothetical protein JWN78_2426 [Bacteroidota bacterium]|nr:hypothetical protein [Bacteroidota bacterium]
MENLKELVNIINRRKLSQIEVFDKSLISRKDTLFAKFYDGIAGGNIHSDEDALDHLYGTGKEAANYRKLKSRFKTRLLNTLYFIDINNSSEKDASKKAYFDCVNRLYLSNILLRYAENRNASIQLILETYGLAKKNNFFDILKEYSYKLLVYYGMTGDEKKYEEEYKAYLSYSKEYEFEQKAQIIYTRVLMAINNNKKSAADKINEVRGYKDEILNLIGDSKSLVIFFMSIRVLLFYYEMLGDNENIKEACDNFLDNYKKYSSSIFSENYLNTIHIYKLKSLFDMRDYDAALQLIKTIASTSKGVSYLAVKEFEIKIYLNTGEVTKALEVLEHIRVNAIYKNANAALKERWYIYNAYLEFVQNYKEDGKYKFSLSKFSNDTPITAQDKSGFNLAARILSILFFIGRNDLDNAMQHIDALKVYQTRYLKDSGASRSNLFIKLLLAMEKKSFNYKELKNLKEFTMLQENKNQVIHESEIIFYDQLWEILSDVMKKNDHRAIGMIR